MSGGGLFGGPKDDGLTEAQRTWKARVGSGAKAFILSIGNVATGTAIITVLVLAWTRTPLPEVLAEYTESLKAERAYWTDKNARDAAWTDKANAHSAEQAENNRQQARYYKLLADALAEPE